MTTKLAYKLSTLTALFLLISTTVVHAAATERVLYSADGVNVGQPYGLVADAAGNLYGASGTTEHPYGSIFKLAKGPTGHWNMTVLYDFRGGTDGDGPNATLTIDSAGNIYGTTIYGGAVRDCDLGCGTIFKLTPSSYLPWKKTTLYSFTGSSDGFYPYAGVTLDSAGNLYGTTGGGGCGTVYQLSAGATGTWSKSILYTFQCAPDGQQPESNLVFDRSGSLYGTTSIGGGGTCPGNYGCGTVFKLTPTSGSWKEQVLYSFKGTTDGGQPGTSGVALDRGGNLYGTTEFGGDFSSCGYGCGVVFELSPSSGGQWTENVLYAFSGGTDGSIPYTTPTRSQSGLLYGVTLAGGSSCGCGTVFQLAESSGNWTESTVYEFSGSDGNEPDSTLILDNMGNLYGTTAEGGADSHGVVFKLFP